jgi:hypothetical protein
MVNCGGCGKELGAHECHPKSACDLHRAGEHASPYVAKLLRAIADEPRKRVADIVARATGPRRMRQLPLFGDA